MPVVITDTENHHEYFFENNFTIDTIIQIKILLVTVYKKSDNVF